MKRFSWILIFLVLTSSFAFGQLDESSTYDDRGKRDPFAPLVDKTGRYLLETDLPYSSEALKLSGILWDPQGRSSALINDEIVKIGESIYGFTIKDIAKDSVTVFKEGQEFILRLTIEEEE